MMIQEAFQYPTRLGRRGASRAGRPLFMARPGPRRRSAEKSGDAPGGVSERDSLAPAAAAPLAVDAAVQVGHLPLRGGEELLELVLEGLIPGGGQGLLGPGGEPGRLGGPGRATGRTGAAGPGTSGGYSASPMNNDVAELFQNGSILALNVSLQQK